MNCNYIGACHCSLRYFYPAPGKKLCSIPYCTPQIMKLPHGKLKCQHFLLRPAANISRAGVTRPLTGEGFENKPAPWLEVDD